MHSNIWKYYLFKFFSLFYLFIPVLVLFYQENNLTMTDIFLLQSIYSIAIVLLEVPTGAIGDYFGRKKSVSFGMFFFSLGLGVYSIGNSFLIFLIGELLCGIGAALVSGSDSALIHSTLKELNRENEYKKIEGNANAFQLIGIMLGGFIGGLVAHYSIRGTMIGSALMALLSFFISLSFIEPRIENDNRIEKNESFKKLIVDSIVIVKNHKLILWLFFYSSIIGALAQIIHWFYQPYFVLVKIPVIHFGLIYAVLGLTAVIASKYTHQIEKFFGNKGSLIFLPLLIIISTIFLGNIISLFAIGLFVLHQIYFGIAQTIFNDRILQVIPSTKAATILSINNLGKRLFYSIVGPLFGYITDTYSVQYTFIVLSLLVLIITIILFIIYKFIPEHFYK